MNPKLRAWIDGPARSWVVSQIQAIWAIVVFATGLEVARGNVSDFRTFFLFITSPSFTFGLFCAIVLGIGSYRRAIQGKQRVDAEAQATNTSTTQGVTP